MGIAAVIAHSVDRGYRAVTLHNGNVNEISRKLLTHCNHPEDVGALIDLGNLSYLGRDTFPDQPHSFDNPAPGVTVAYARDRGEALRIENFRNMDDLNDFQDGGVPIFLYEDDKWHVKFGYLFIPVVPEMFSVKD